MLWGRAGEAALGETIQFVLFAGLLLTNGFFTAAETAMLRLRPDQLHKLQGGGQRTLKKAAALLREPQAYLTACQLGITLASLGMGWMGIPAFRLLFDSWLAGRSGRLPIAPIVAEVFAVAAALLLAAVLHSVCGTLVPKAIAGHRAKRVVVLAAAPLFYFHKVMYPLARLLDLLSSWMFQDGEARVGSGTVHTYSSQDIRLLLKESKRSGHIQHTELLLVDNIFKFIETHAREIMIPRREVICLYTQLSLAENKQMALAEMHTRYPVCESDKDDIIGFVHIKDLWKDAEHTLTDIEQILRPIITVPESIFIRELLGQMQESKTQIAILIDEYGGTSGIVTLEDIMEEIVGEIQDEFDEERAMIEQLGEGSHSISGMMLIEEVNSCLGTNISCDNFDTIGGWMYSQLENLPRKGNRVKAANHFEFVIEETDHYRISRIRVSRLAASSSNKEQEGVMEDVRNVDGKGTGT
ncbi:hemolysin family protein [Paenibacillus sp. KS-LC4]|uniref:hemolysin family protein n=1 Tax=Paenibacillus sp. KS-LC4 TaxID=2979727 RepID=UPI0030D58F69